MKVWAVQNIWVVDGVVGSTTSIYSTEEEARLWFEALVLINRRWERPMIKKGLYKIEKNSNNKYRVVHSKMRTKYYNEYSIFRREVK